MMTALTQLGFAARGGRRRSLARSGFTLVEICIVMLVAFVLVSCLWLVYRGILRAGRSTEDTATAVARAQLAMERVRTDLLTAGAGEVALDEAGGLNVSAGGEGVVSYRQQQAGALVREAEGKLTQGPEETQAAFRRIPERPRSLVVTVTSKSHDREVVLQCEHACENEARKSQHPEWNLLVSAGSAQEPAGE